MSRILVTLAALSLLLMLTTMLLGLSLGDLDRNADVRTLHWATAHRLTGIAAALGIVFVNSVVVTYFIGTSRWCREVVNTYGLDRQFVARSLAVKRRAFPWSLVAILVVIAVAASGAAADPSTGRRGTEAWVTYHLMGSFAGLMLISIAYVAQWNALLVNQQIIDQIVVQVQRLRGEYPPE